MSEPFFRELYERLLEAKDPGPKGLLEGVVRPWLRDTEPEMSMLEPCKRSPEDATSDGVSDNDLWNLYSLQRVSDFLLLPFQATVDHAWTGPRLTLADYQELFCSLGMAVDRTEAYHPFYHEIVDLEPSTDPDEPITILETRWQVLLFGEMTFARAGVRVRAGERAAAKGIADRSTLYWTPRRLRRPTEDLSMGWGSNSSRRTRFRRDYRTDGTYKYNVDGSWDARNAVGAHARATDDLIVSERVELCRNRCFVTCPKVHEDRFPYDYTWTEPAR